MHQAISEGGQHRRIVLPKSVLINDSKNAAHAALVRLLVVDNMTDPSINAE